MPTKKPLEVPLYVKLPSAAGDKLHRAAEALGVPKKDLVAELVTRYIELDLQPGRSARAASPPKPIQSGPVPMMGTYSFQASSPPEVMSSAQAGEFLQISEKNVIELAESGRLPGKKLGTVWRFSRNGLVAWLETPEVKK